MKSSFINLLHIEKLKQLLQRSCSPRSSSFWKRNTFLVMFFSLEIYFAGRMTYGVGTEETLDSLRAELDLKDEAFSALNRVVRAKAQEIQDLQQANESLETCVRQLNRDLEALKEYSKSKEPVKIQLNSS